MLVDQQTGNVISSSIRTSYFFHKRLKGLMFDSHLPVEEAMHIKPCHSVHTCFMRFPIDVVFVDESLEVVAIEEYMKPFRFGKPVPSAQSVFEFAAGTVKEKELYVGQKLLLKQWESEWNGFA